MLLFTVIFVSCEKQDTNTPVDVEKDTTLSLSPTFTEINDNSGTVYINIKTDTKWIVTVNNLGAAGIKDIDVSPLSGSKDRTKYGKRANVLSNAKESTSIVIFYYSFGYRQGVTSTIQRK